MTILFTAVAGIQTNQLNAATSSKVNFLDDVVKIDGSYALDKSGFLWKLDERTYTASALIDQVKAFSDDGAVIRTDGSVWTQSGSAYVQIKELPAARDIEKKYIIDTQGNVWSLKEKKQIAKLKNIVKLDVTDYDAALDKDGNVWIWGLDPRGFLNGNETFGPTLYFKNIRHLHGGIAIDNDWKIFNIWTVVYLDDPSPEYAGFNKDLYAYSKRIKDIFAYNRSEETNHSYVILTDGTVWSWGATEREGFYPVKGLSDVAAVTGTYSHGSALYKNGHVASWSASSFYVQSGALKSKGIKVTPHKITTPYTYIGMRLKGNLKAFPSLPILHENRVYLPLRGFFESIGGTVSVANDTIKISYNNHLVEMTVSRNEAFIDGQKVIIDAPAQIMSGKTMVPARFISQSLGADIKWDALNKIIELNYAEKIEQEG